MWEFCCALVFNSPVFGQVFENHHSFVIFADQLIQNEVDTPKQLKIQIYSMLRSLNWVVQPGFI